MEESCQLNLKNPNKTKEINVLLGFQWCNVRILPPGFRLGRTTCFFYTNIAYYQDSFIHCPWQRLESNQIYPYPWNRICCMSLCQIVFCSRHPNYVALSIKLQISEEIWEDSNLHPRLNRLDMYCCKCLKLSKQDAFLLLMINSHLHLVLLQASFSGSGSN